MIDLSRSARPGTDVPMPNAARKIHDLAVAHSWRVIPGGINAPRPAVALLLRRDSEQLIARWDDGKFASAWQRITVPTDGPVSPVRLSSAALRAAIASPPAAGAAEKAAITAPVTGEPCESCGVVARLYTVHTAQTVEPFRVCQRCAAGHVQPPLPFDTEGEAS